MSIWSMVVGMVVRREVKYLWCGLENWSCFLIKRSNKYQLQVRYIASIASRNNRSSFLHGKYVRCLYLDCIYDRICFQLIFQRIAFPKLNQDGEGMQGVLAVLFKEILKLYYYNFINLSDSNYYHDNLNNLLYH